MTNQEKVEAAKRSLGSRHVLAKGSTFPPEGWKRPISKLRLIHAMALRAGRL